MIADCGREPGLDDEGGRTFRGGGLMKVMVSNSLKLFNLFFCSADKSAVRGLRILTGGTRSAALAALNLDTELPLDAPDLFLFIFMALFCCLFKTAFTVSSTGSSSSSEFSGFSFGGKGTKSYWIFAVRSKVTRDGFPANIPRQDEGLSSDVT
jgi:hypothetical protein